MLFNKPGRNKCTNLLLCCGSSSNMKTVFSYVSGKSAQLFTSVLYNNYAPPPGFCFDILCDDEPFIDDKHSPDYNVDKLVCLTHHLANK